MALNPHPEQQPRQPGATPAQPLPAVFAGSLLTPGTEPLPGYKLTRFLGRGGFGEVWQARGPGNFDVALKFVRITQAETTRVELRALDVMKSVRHPHLLPLFGAWRTTDFLIIAMELADCTLLDRWRKSHDQGLSGIPVVELLEYLREAAKAIDFLNERRHPGPDGKLVGIQHRDLKPQNLLLVGGCVKVADFDLVRVLVATIGPGTGGMTLAYAAPESFDGKATRWSDQYSLAITYCELRGGRLPFEGNHGQMIVGHLTRPPDLSMIPEVERQVVGRALAKTPAERWGSCREFVEALAVANALPVQTPASGPDLVLPPPPRPRKRRPWKLLAAATLLLAGLAALVVFVRRLNEPPPVVGEVRLVEPKDLSVEVGTSVPLEVRLHREGSVPELQVKVEGLPEQVQVKPVTVGTSRDVAILTVTADADAPLIDKEVRVVAVADRVRTAVPLRLRVTFNKEQQRRVADWVGGLKGKAEMDGPDGAVLTVALPGTPVTDADLRKLRGLPHLRELHLGPCRQVSNRGLRYIKGLRALEKLDLPGAAITDDGLQYLEGLTHLQELNLSGCAGVDDGLKHLKGLKTLRKLSLSSTAVTDAGLQHLKDLTSLQELNLNHCQRVGDKGLAHLQKLEALQTLRLSFTAVTDAGLQHLRNLQSLKKLKLVSTKVTDVGLAYLKDLTRLEELNLCRCEKVSDLGLQHLKGLTSLRTLALGSTRVTDRGLKNLMGLADFERLHIPETLVPGEGIAALRQKWPKLEVWR
jgi:serine/threonine protein kinase